MMILVVEWTIYAVEKESGNLLLRRSCSLSCLYRQFSNSLIIHKEITKEINVSMSVWKCFNECLEKLLSFVSLISPSEIILFEKQYQAFDTVFHHQMKHLEVCQKYSTACCIFNSLLGVLSGDETLCLMLDILLQNMIHFILFQFTIIISSLFYCLYLFSDGLWHTSLPCPSGSAITLWVSCLNVPVY